MAYQWTQDWAVGVDQIDRQHQELVARVNALLAAMSQGKGRDEVGRTISFLESYVSTHFGAEEKLMASRAYPSIESHKALHAAFVNDFLALKQSLLAGGDSTALTLQVQRRVGDWLINHIGKVDKLLGQFLSAAPAR
jgi:hemerythrin